MEEITFLFNIRRYMVEYNHSTFLNYIKGTKLYTITIKYVLIQGGIHKQSSKINIYNKTSMKMIK